MFRFRLTLWIHSPLTRAQISLVLNNLQESLQSFVDWSEKKYHEHLLLDVVVAEIEHQNSRSLIQHISLTASLQIPSA